MSFKGEVEAKCPNGCEPFSTEVWSFIRGDRDPELRERVMWRECNLIICPHCSAAFVPTAPYVYFEPKAELLAFVFPESFREREDFWRKKMSEDYLQMRQTLGEEMKVELEPQLFFGPEGLAKLLEDEDYRDEEREVMEMIARELGLSVYAISARFARERGVPSALPYAARQGQAVSKSDIVAGLEKLLASNDRLTGCQKALEALRDPKQELPPASGKAR